MTRDARALKKSTLPREGVARSAMPTPAASPRPLAPSPWASARARSSPIECAARRSPASPSPGWRVVAASCSRQHPFEIRATTRFGEFEDLPFVPAVRTGQRVHFIEQTAGAHVDLFPEERADIKGRAPGVFA